MNATTQRQPSQISSGAAAPAWSAAQQHVAEGLSQHEHRLHIALRTFIRSFGLATDAKGVESLLPELMGAIFDVAIQNADRYDPACSLSAWLRTIAYNCVRDQKRKTKRVVPIAETRQVVGHAEQGQLSEAEMFDLFQEIVNPQTQLALDDLLPLVPTAYHEVLKLHVNHGLKGVALAAQMRLSEGAAATKLCRARVHLAKAYQTWHSS